MSRIAAIALGSNLASPWGDREANLREAIARVAKLGEVQGVSSFHDTAPVGYADQPNFLNGAMLLQRSWAGGVDARAAGDRAGDGAGPRCCH